jgi:predicted transcriptional regulator
MQLLGNLLDGPMRPTKLGQECHLSYPSLTKHVNVLIIRKSVDVSPDGTHELYSITTSGRWVYCEYRKLCDTLYSPRSG